MRRRFVSLLWVVLVGAACAPASRLEGKACDAAGTCPSGLVCYEGSCRAEAAVACFSGSRVPGEKLIPECGAWFGVAPSVRPSWGEALTAVEAAVGKQFRFVHAFEDWLTPIPTPAQEEAVRGGTLVLIDWVASRFATQTLIPWSEIASGTHDAWIREQASRFKALEPARVFLSFSGKPEATLNVQGTVAEFVQAYRHVRDTFIAEGATNVVWVWTVTGSSRDYALYTAGLYPGDDAVDWIAWSRYNAYRCQSASGAWVDMEPLLSPFYSWLQTNGFAEKPYMLSELASVEDPDDAERKASWLLSLKELFPRAFPNIKAVSYYSSNSIAACDYRLVSSTRVSEATRALMEEPYFGMPE